MERYLLKNAAKCQKYSLKIRPFNVKVRKCLQLHVNSMHCKCPLAVQSQVLRQRHDYHTKGLLFFVLVDSCWQCCCNQKLSDSCTVFFYPKFFLGSSRFRKNNVFRTFIQDFKIMFVDHSSLQRFQLIFNMKWKNFCKMLLFRSSVHIADLG